MGDAINMAARLMCHKEAKRGILCDEKTYNLCESDFRFENLGETTVKGKNSAISIFRPLITLEAEESKESEATNINTVIGREAEKKAIAEAIASFSSEVEVSNLFIFAEVGQGLTTLSSHTKSEASKLGFKFW
jgi:hypothetical protein